MTKQRANPDPSGDDPRAARHSEPPRRPSRLVWLGSRLLVVALLLAAVLFFAPWIVTSSGAWKAILSAAAPELASQIEIQSLQLAWLSPIEVRGLAVRDPAGAALAEIPIVRSRKTLLALALDHRELGTFELREPKFNLVLRADGSNVEDLLAKLPKSEGSSAPVGFGLALEQGSVQFDDRVSGRQWQLGGLAVELAWPAAADQAKAGKLAGNVRPAADGGQFAAEFSWQAAGDKAPLGAGQAKLTAQGIPVELTQGALRRFVSDIRPQGPLTMQAAASWNQPAESAQVSVSQLTSPGLALAAPALLGADQPAISIAAGQADIELSKGRATVRNLDLRTSLLAIGGKAAAAAGNVAESGDLEITGQLNLAELARQLPATLHLKENTQVTAGTAAFTLVSRAESGGRHWQTSLKTVDLRGSAGGRPIQFDQPLELEADIRQTPQGPVIDKLVGHASFLELEGRGALAAGNVTARADLNRLVSELGRLVEWGDTRLAGTVGAELRWQQDQATGWTGNADVAVQNFEVQSAGMAPWREPSLHLAASVQGSLAASSLEQIHRGKLLIEAAADRMDAELTEPVKAPSATSIWPVKFTLRGDLASWAPRLRPFVSLRDWRMAGAVSAAGSGRLSPGESQLGQTTVEISQFVLDGPGVSIREPGAPGVPGVKVETSGAWSQSRRTLVLGGTTLATSAVAFAADDVRLVLGNEPSLTGQADFRCDLARLSNWLATAQQPRTSQLGGAVIGRVEIGYRGQSLAANWNADIENLAYLAAPPPQTAARTQLTAASTPAAWQTVWQEPRVNFAGQGTFDPATSTLKIERTTLAASSASLAAAGAVSKLSTGPEVDLTGEVAYDLAIVTQQIQARVQKQATSAASPLPYGLETLQLAGKEKRQFQLKGPLLAATGSLSPAGTPSVASPAARVSDALTGEASLGWEGAQYVGLVAGPADFKAKLAGGVVQVGPLDIPLAEGRLTTAPRVLLNDRSPAVVVDRGPLLQNVRISPEMCSLWLKYVAPLVAEATRAEGKFSLSLEGANVPVSAPIASTLAGTLSIQSAQIGPGPLAQQYLGMAKQLKSLLSGAAASASEEESRGWMIMPQQEVFFEVREGVATNRGLKMSIGDVVITTEGSVHIESQRINLIASVPLNESWFKGQAGGLLTGLKGQSIQIPIDGTLTQPRLDTRVLQTIGQQLAGAAVQGALGKQLERGQGMLNKELQKGEGLLQNELSKGLNRLFGPLQPKTPQPPPSPAPR